MARSGPLRTFASLLVLGACAFTVVSLVTFDRHDLATYHMPPASPVHNSGGIVGARLADFVWQGMGLGVGVVVVLGMAWSVLNLLGRGSEKIVVRATGAVVLVGCVCTFASTSAPPPDLVGYGGTVGVALHGVVQHYFGAAGLWLLGIPISLLALMMLSVDELVVPPLLRAAAAAGRGIGLLRQRAADAKVQPATQKKAKPAKAAPVAEEAPDDAVAEPEPEPKRRPAFKALFGKTKPEPKDAEPEAQDTGRPVTVGYMNRMKQDSPPQTIDVDGTPAAGDGAVMAGMMAEHRGADAKPYVLPPITLLDKPEVVDHSQRGEHVQEQIDVLERTLREFGIGATVVDIDQGPVVTRYELTLQAGTKLSKVTALSDDLAIATKAPAVRIVAPIPGKSTIGIELPNTDTELVRMRELLESKAAERQRNIPLFLGKDASGQPIVADLTRMPHLLIAGATGSGKSVCINTIISSILFTRHPDDVRLVLIDPKVVELAHYADLPHLLTPVVTDMKRAAWILDWACKTMDERYDTLARVGVRSISAYNRLSEDEIRDRVGELANDAEYPFHLPYIVIIVDELADMMMMASKNIETSITRLAQKSRAVGLHIILATQRPSVDVITGLIKSNLPTRISFQVTSKVDSRTILDRNGAEKLLGCGDMLFLAPGTADMLRAQGTFLSDEEVLRVVQFIKDQREPDFRLKIGSMSVGGDDGAPDGSDLEGFSGDERYEEACRVVLASRRGSVSLLQRKLEIGYTRAARLIDMMAIEGIVGDYKGAKAREVVMSLDEWDAQRGGGAGGPASDAPNRGLDDDLLQESTSLEDVEDDT
ncbi:MAG: DNA translocase FtsK [Candidatus Brocadiae bacterium]|nr:DNA translocase FtsK [Candidatus Brocadiia bacterium]